MNDELKRHIDNLVDTFACGDGGAKLVTFLAAMRDVSEQVNTGTEDTKLKCKEIIKIVTTMSKLVDAVTRRKQEI